LCIAYAAILGGTLELDARLVDRSDEETAVTSPE
jgi:hypothetical protein